MIVDLCKQEVYHLYSLEVFGHLFSICVGNFNFNMFLLRMVSYVPLVSSGFYFV